MQLIGGMKYERGIVGIDNGKFYVMTNENAPKGKIVTYDAEHISPASCAEFIPEQESVLTGAAMADHKFILTYDKDASSHPYLYDKNGKLVYSKKVGKKATSKKTKKLPKGSGYKVTVTPIYSSVYMGQAGTKSKVKVK